MNKARAKEIYVSLVTFFVPESVLSLKLIFDNVRNYGIIALMFLLGAWLSRENSFSNSTAVSAVGLSGVKFAGVSTFVAVLLFLSNFAQSVILVVWMLKPVFDFSILFEPTQKTDLTGWVRFRRFIMSLVRMWIVLGIVILLVDFAVAVTKFAIVSGTR